MEEIWKPIPGYNGYEVSNTGKVKSYKIKKEGILLTQSVTKKDDLRLKVKLINNIGEQKHIGVHRLVMLAFCPIENSELYEVNHKDGNCQNNNLDNLEWMTSEENHKHYKEVLIPQRRTEGTFCVGRKADIYKITFINGIVHYYKGYQEIVDKLGVSRNCITRWANGQLSFYVQNFEKVDSIPENWINEPVKIPKQRNTVVIEYRRKETEYYDDCHKADLALNLPKGTIFRWSNRNWNKVSQGKATQLGIKRVYIIKDDDFSN